MALLFDRRHHIARLAGDVPRKDGNTRSAAAPPNETCRKESLVTSSHASRLEP